MLTAIELAIEIYAQLRGCPVFIDEGIDWLERIERLEPIVEIQVVGEWDPLVQVGAGRVFGGLVQG